MRAEFLTRKHVRRINDLIERAYGVRLDEDSYHYSMRRRDLYRVSRELERVDVSKLSEVFAGLYLCEVLDETVRFSVEGSQIVGPHATRSVVTLERGEWLLWLERENIVREHWDEDGFVIVCNEAGDFFGSGLIRESVLKSWIPKGRAVNEAH